VLLRLDAQIQALTMRVARQDERIAQFERRLNRSSRNSSIPPSADPPAGTPKRGKYLSGRKQGSEPGWLHWHLTASESQILPPPLVPQWARDEALRSRGYTQGIGA
jgi:transposase